MHPFKKDISHISLPEQFTYPFHYTPHPLCVLAAEEVQAYLQSRTDWHDELQGGKMFGVLVVRDAHHRIGYLAAFSGNLAGSNHHDFFVPPVYDLLNPDGYFKQEEARISALNHLIDENPYSFSVLFRTEQSVVKNLKNAHAVIQTTSPHPFCHPDDRREEGSQKHQVDATEILRRDAPLNDNKEEINRLKEERKTRSIALQQWIFQQFILRNARGEEQSIDSIFSQTARRNPPAGTGECAAPKLLQYAYQNHLQPLAMAEFWWGNSPKGEIRRHGYYYPSCRHKCEPILHFMMQGLDVEPNPLLALKTDADSLTIVYEDDYLLLVNKPAGMLSVPGKDGLPSVYTYIKERYPDATGPLLVHRLDMHTSGLLLIAKDKDIHARLQEQFETRQVKKRYIALLEGIPQGKETKGFIRLPMRPDYDNRPLQMVDFEYGKPAVTRYEILAIPVTLNEVKDPNRTRIAYWPETGRTHQLRVHSAHPDGMDCPIVGDPLYGQPADRLYLHAEQLEFRHPASGKMMRISCESPF